MKIRPLLAPTLIGLTVGLLWAITQPRTYEASVTIFFPTMQTEPLLKLNEALQTSPDSHLDSTNQTTGSPETGKIASVVFASQAAAEFALQKDGDTGSSHRWGDPLEQFQKRLQVTETAPATLTLQLSSRSGETARAQLQALLDYYTAFVKKTPLTRVRRTREQLEVRLAKTVKSLRSLEDKMSRSSSKELRALGDSAIKANPKVMTQLWLRRLEEDQRGRELLNKMQKVRGTPKRGSRPEDAWISQWAKDQKHNPKPSPGLLRLPIRRQDLLERAQLEREYYEALLTHRSLLLQHSFLLTWDSLENQEYSVVDPLRVRSHRGNAATTGLAGASLGLVLGLLLALFSPRRASAQ